MFGICHIVQKKKSGLIAAIECISVNIIKLFFSLHLQRHMLEGTFEWILLKNYKTTLGPSDGPPWPASTAAATTILMDIIIIKHKIIHKIMMKP